MGHRELLWRYLMFFAGVVCSALGIALITLAGRRYGGGRGRGYGDREEYREYRKCGKDGEYGEEPADRRRGRTISGKCI